MKIIFMGTPDFAVPCLDILYQSGYDIVGVITATDKKGGRGGKKLIESAVKKYAVEKQLNILQPKNLKAPEFINELSDLQADLQVVVAFRMLPVVVWDMPPLGTINLHGSLLPAYRGAAPIHWAVINGEKETGVTTFFLKHEIDTGDMLMQSKLPIQDDDSTGNVHDKMMMLGAEVVLESVARIEARDYSLQPQDDSKVSKAPKIHTDTCQINFDQPTQRVYDFIRGMNPFPTAWTTLEGKQFKIFKVKKHIENHSNEVGTYDTDSKKYLRFFTQDGYVEVLELKLEGKRKMTIKDFLNGYKFEEIIQ